MIISVNPNPPLSEFQSLMAKANEFLNADAQKRPTYYASRSGTHLEFDVMGALEECSKGTLFEGTIENVSGHHFPDIVAARLYGVEVKSTQGNHWTSTGSSILETTRVPDVKRIYMTFGKLGGTPIEFLSRPYEECLCDIAVTHMPRYKINMCLSEGETIFDKMKIPYDDLGIVNMAADKVPKQYRFPVYKDLRQALKERSETMQ